jgi:hypothetical protein
MKNLMTIISAIATVLMLIIAVFIDDTFISFACYLFAALFGIFGIMNIKLKL